MSSGIKSVGIIKIFHVRPLKRVKKWKHLRWRVIVVATGRDVRKLYETGPHGRSKGIHAFCRAWKHPVDNLGIIVLQQKDGAGVTCHECLHAAIRTECFIQTGRCWGKAMKWKEEHLAAILGNLNREIVNAGWRYGIYKDNGRKK